jgi:RNA polymerase sigma-70 factor (sigma-E family)
VRVHGDSLVQLSYVLCGDRGRAEDAAQEALTRVYLRWKNIEDPLPYARQCVVNATNDEWRRFGRDRRREDRAAAEPAESLAEFDGLLADRDRLVQALRSLPYGQRAIVVLRYWHQLSEPETAQVLGISVGTVKSQTSRALHRLRQLLSSSNYLDKYIIEDTVTPNLIPGTSHVSWYDHATGSAQTAEKSAKDTVTTWTTFNANQPYKLTVVDTAAKTVSTSVSTLKGTARPEPAPTVLLPGHPPQLFALGPDLSASQLKAMAKGGASTVGKGVIDLRPNTGTRMAYDYWVTPAPSSCSRSSCAPPTRPGPRTRPRTTSSPRPSPSRPRSTPRRSRQASARPPLPSNPPAK